MTSILSALAKATLTALEAVISRTATLTGTAFDTAGYEGQMAVILAAGAATAGTNPTLNCKIQHSHTTTSGDFVDLPGAAFSEVTNAASQQLLTIDRKECRRYIRLVGTLGGTSTPTFPYGAAFLAQKKYD